ncbi:MAG: hypothetical protein Ct9H300mP1_24010 [Planctomycetaceae bacterium]|nr:MAG: hypothetical protein Ct9H300mP1_24010 [Planctomycetaceae bacterium]
MIGSGLLIHASRTAEGVEDVQTKLLSILGGGLLGLFLLGLLTRRATGRSAATPTAVSVALVTGWVALGSGAAAGGSRRCTSGCWTRSGSACGQSPAVWHRLGTGWAPRHRRPFTGRADCLDDRQHNNGDRTGSPGLDRTGDVLQPVGQRSENAAAGDQVPHVPGRVP